MFVPGRRRFGDGCDVDGQWMVMDITKKGQTLNEVLQCREGEKSREFRRLWCSQFHDPRRNAIEKPHGLVTRTIALTHDMKNKDNVSSSQFRTAL